ncbi:unnamed protein product [Fraxinus pennsylvanica]|uniref:Uncharacterized protein n=1 Tax=Fraxinus pennsylvanica TaxID=56036 RepID=A0AAD2DQJ0_9LAMI|nr:unnamed protein product [Fraxinus pennsylvanica]
MENGEGNLESKFAGMVVSDTNDVNGNDGLFQVMTAVEAAEATIKQQMFRLRTCGFSDEVDSKVFWGLALMVISWGQDRINRVLNTVSPSSSTLGQSSVLGFPMVQHF